jgi:CRISPR/Cas system CMR subunit Cmr6 (Cas7 group RAMP superfamily)
MVIGDLVIEKKKANQSITKRKASEARSKKVSKRRSILSIERIEIHQSITNQSITNQSITNQSITNQSITNQSITNQSITNQSITNAPTLPLLSELFEPDHTTRCGADRSGGM